MARKKREELGKVSFLGNVTGEWWRSGNTLVCLDSKNKELYWLDWQTGKGVVAQYGEEDPMMLLATISGTPQWGKLPADFAWEEDDLVPQAEVAQLEAVYLNAPSLTGHDLRRISETINAQRQPQRQPGPVRDQR